MNAMTKAVVVLGCAAGLVAGVAAQTMQINGAGATFPYPIYSKWFSEYNKLHSNVQINYQSIGSGGGIRQFTNQTVFFGATDGPMTNEQLIAAPSKILHFPTVLGAVVPVYNIPGVKAELKFTGTVLADIFLGKITKWNDPAIAKLNAGVSLARDRHHGRAPLRRVGHDLHLGGLPRQGVARVAEEGRRGHGGELADRRRREGQRGRVRPRHADARVDRLRRADLRAAEQDQLRLGAEHGRRIPARFGRVRDGGGGGGGGEDAGRLPCVDHQRGRQGRLSDFVLHLDSAL